MNIISSLQNLEKKLNQIKPFLATKEPQKSVEIPQLFTELDSNINAMKQYAQFLDKNLLDLSNIELGNMQIDVSGNPINIIAKNAASQAKVARENYNTTIKNITNSWDIIAKIGNSFTKNLLTQDQKTKFIALLTKFADYANILKNIATELAPVDIMGNFNFLKFEDTTLTPPDIYVGYFIESVKLEFMPAYNKIILSTSRIKELMENDLAFIKEDIQEIKNLEQQIQNMYKQTLQIFEQIKKFAIPGKEQELQEASKKLAEIDNDPISALTQLVEFINGYASFIKDNNLKKELLITLQNPALLLYEKFTQEMSKLSFHVVPDNITPFINHLSSLFWNLEQKIKKVEDILK